LAAATESHKWIRKNYAVPEGSVKMLIRAYGRQDRWNISEDHSVNTADHFINFTRKEA